MLKSTSEVTPENYLETNRLLLMWVGLNRPVGAHVIIDILFVIRAFLVIGVYVVMSIGCYAHMVHITKFDLLSSSVNILQIIISIMAILHVVYHGTRNAAVHKLIAKFRKVSRFSSNTGHVTMEKQIRWNRILSCLWLTVITSCTFSFYVLALAAGVNAIPVWAPIDLKKPLYNLINNVLQFSAQVMVGSLGGCFSGFSMSVLSLLTYQFEMLCTSLEHVAPLAVLKTRKRIQNEGRRPLNNDENAQSEDLKVSEGCECCTEEFKQFFESFEKRRYEKSLTSTEELIYQRELYDAFRECIIHHQNLLDLHADVENYFGPVIFLKFAFCSVMLCFIVFSSSKFVSSENFSPTNAIFISLVAYYITASGEVCLTCFVADRLMRKGEIVTEVVYRALPWYSGSVKKKFVSSWQIFHLRASSPPGLRIILYTVSLELMTLLFRASFSFYTVLQKLQ